MKKIILLLLSFGSVFGLIACNDSTAPPVADEKIQINLYQPSWSSSKLVYKTTQDIADFKTLDMNLQENGWWTISVQANRLEFAFEDSNGVRIDLGGTQGCYSGDHWKCDDISKAENFRTSSPQVWVKDGLILTSNPANTSGNKEVTVLSVNLHTYQEFSTEGLDNESELTNEQAQQRIKDHAPLFDKIADAINKLDPDLVCLQEVGEWSGGAVDDPENIDFGKDSSNMVLQILKRLDNKNYNYFTDWSHYGWDVWLEGSAVLSKHPLTKTESRYISNPDNGTHKFWKSRNVVKAQVNLGDLGKINVFSVHAGWWDDAEEPFQDQFKRLKNWASEASEKDTTTLFCGDFNQVAGTKEQQFITNNTGYSDQYALANPDGLLDSTIGGSIDGWIGEVGKRIDLFLTNDDSKLSIKQSQRIFTEGVFGRVSDHTGIYAQFGLKNNALESVEGIAPYQLYLSGSLTGDQAARGLRFEHLGNNKYQLITWIGAAANDKESDLLPHKLLITDRSGTFSLGSTSIKGENIKAEQLIQVTESINGFYFELEEAGLFQIDLNYNDKTLIFTKK